MDRRNNFLFLVLLGTVGILVAAILFRGGSGARPAPGPGGQPGVESNAGSRPESRTAAVPGDPRDAGAAGDAARREVTAPAAAAADGMISLRGRLVVDRGGPAVGVGVSWRRHDGFGFDVDLPVRDGPDRPATMQTDAEGRFELRVDANRRGSIALDRSANLLFASSDVRRVDVAASERDTDLGDLPVTAAGTLVGRVVDEVGQPVPSAKVRANRDSLSMWMPGRGQSVDGEGVFELTGLEPGQHVLGAEATGFVPATLPIEVGAGDVVRDVVLTMTRGVSLAGTVLDDRGLPIAAAKVAAFRDRELGPNVQVQSIDAGAAVESDVNGYFVLSGIEGSRVSLRAWAEGCTSQILSDVAVGTGNATFRLARLGRITGTLLDTEGQPLAGSTVSARVFDDAGPSLGVDVRGMAPTAETDAEGLFAIEGVRPGTVSIDARGTAHLPVEGFTVQVVAGATVANVMLRAETGAVVVATVVDAVGRPIQDATVTVTEPPKPAPAAGGPGGGARRIEMRAAAGPGGPVEFLDGSQPRVLREARTDAEGRVRLAGLPTGPVRVRATSGAHAPSRPADLSVPRRGDIEAFLTLRPAGRVVVRTVDAAGAAAPEVPFVLRGPQGADALDGVVERGKTDATGVARLGPFLEGRYTAAIELSPRATSIGDGMSFMMTGDSGQELAQTTTELAVAAGEDVEVVLQRPVLTRVYGTVLAATGPEAGLEVRLTEEDAPGLAPGWTVKTDSSGAYEVEDVPAGRYRLEWGRAGQIVKFQDELEVLAGSPELRRDLELRGGSIRVQVVGAADGQPIVAAEVSLRRAGEAQRPQNRVMMVQARMSTDDDAGGGSTSSITMGGPGRVRTGDDGVAVIEDVPPGDYVLVAERKGFTDGRVGEVHVVDGQQADVGVLRLSAAGAVAGAVTGFAEDAPMRIAMIEARKAGSEDEPRRETAMGGSFRVDRLEPGDWELRARAVGRDSGSPGPWRTATVRAGATEALDLPLSGD